jgi:hypothetical protein
LAMYIQPGGQNLGSHIAAYSMDRIVYDRDSGAAIARNLLRKGVCL